MKTLSGWQEDDDELDDRFWGAPDSWPVDTDKYVFLARALDQIGSVDFGDAWNDQGPDEPRDDTDEADIDHIDECEAAEARYIQLRRVVRDKMIDLFRRAKLKAGLRPTEGGDIREDLVEAMWNTENCERRFKRCDVSINGPFSNRGFARATHYIYVARNDLEELLTLSNNSKPQKSPHKLKACMRALQGCYGPTGPARGMQVEKIRRQIVQWAREQGEELDVSVSYLARALKKVREP